MSGRPGWLRGLASPPTTASFSGWCNEWEREPKRNPANGAESASTPVGRDAIIGEAAREVGDAAFSLVVMLDGVMLRSRGPDWGMKPASRSGDRVAWHELKAGLVMCIPESKADESTKYYVATPGGPDEVGRALYAEALRRGLEQAGRVYVLADGAAWIWRISSNRFPDAEEELDFYHASEHLWALARDLWGEEELAREWVLPLLKDLKRRGGASLFANPGRACGCLGWRME